MSDLQEYLNKHTGINIGDELLMHELWADDLYLVSDITKNSQKQLNDVNAFCTSNQMIINGIKTKCMVFGNINNVKLYYNDEMLEVVDAYKYLGNIFNRTIRVDSDIFGKNTAYLVSQSRKAIFSINRKLNQFGECPPKVKLHLFIAMV